MLFASCDDNSSDDGANDPKDFSIQDINGKWKIELNFLRLDSTAVWNLDFKLEGHDLMNLNQEGSKLWMANCDVKEKSLYLYSDHFPKDSFFVEIKMIDIDHLTYRKKSYDITIQDTTYYDWVLGTGQRIKE